MQEIEPRDALGIARRALANLSLLTRAYEGEDDGHLVTQIIATSLAVLVLPWERYYRDDADIIHLTARPGSWSIDRSVGDQAPDLRHLRNALAHGGIEIESVSRAPSQVLVRFEDRADRDEPISWSATIRADDLEVYIRALFEQLEDRFD
jgi:hypothetical protein